VQAQAAEGTQQREEVLRPNEDQSHLLEQERLGRKETGDTNNLMPVCTAVARSTCVERPQHTWRLKDTAEGSSSITYNPGAGPSRTDPVKAPSAAWRSPNERINFPDLHLVIIQSMYCMIIPHLKRSVFFCFISSTSVATRRQK
jgi:hypothetical protein